ncbi:hypothetical protein GBA52_027378 [Prunus armeniaca]|nr:hypothetical protein GBA52_027378 [Prunus armeniaca]
MSKLGRVGVGQEVAWSTFREGLEKKPKDGGIRRCRGSNPGHPRDRREYLPLYYNDSVWISWRRPNG